MLHVEIVTDDCVGDEAHIFDFPQSTSPVDIISAIGVMFPTATSIYIEVRDEESSAEETS